jgi:hypothetical protein
LIANGEGFIGIEGREAFCAILASVVAEMPASVHQGLEHIAIEVSDGRYGSAYGAMRRSRRRQAVFKRSIVIFRDTLVSEVGHDLPLLRGHISATIVDALALPDADPLARARWRSHRIPIRRREDVGHRVAELGS